MALRTPRAAAFALATGLVAHAPHAPAQARAAAPPAAPAAAPSATPAPLAPLPPATPVPAAPNAPNGANNASAEPALPPEPPPRELSLTEVFAIARRDPPAVLTALAQARAAEAQVAVARAPSLPSVSGSVSTSIFGSNGQFFSMGFVSPNTQQGIWSADASVSARWTALDFGRNAAQVRAAERSVDAARADAREAQRAAVAQAGAAFFQLLSDHQLASSTRETVRQRERQHEIARGLVEAGARPPIEQTRAEVALDAARLDLLTAETAARNDAATLATALALDPAVPLRPVAPSAGFAIDDDPTHAAALAERTRNDVASARTRVEQAEASLAAARAAYYPTVSLTASLSARFTHRFGTTAVLPSQQAQAGLNIAVPIYDPAIPAQVRSAEAAVASAQATLRARSLAVRSEAVQAAINVRSTRVAMAQAERLAAGAAANLAQAEGRYAAGAAQLLELVDAQAADATARVSVVRARLAHELAKVRLLAAVGSLDALDGG